MESVTLVFSTRSVGPNLQMLIQDFVQALVRLSLHSCSHILAYR